MVLRLMNIYYHKGNLLKSDAQALLNTVNCLGVMGKGIALQFKQAFPENFKQYVKACKNKEVQPGKMNVYATGTEENPFYIINFPTKIHWKDSSKLEYLQHGLKDLIRVIKQYNIRSIAIPPLGCGLGGLKWHIVEPIIVKLMQEVPQTKVIIYPPQASPKAQEMPVRTKVPAMNRMYALLIKLIEQYQLPGYLLSLLEVQKIAYFLQIFGEDLQLNFVKHKYGPYAETLNHVLQRMEGHYIRGYGDRNQESEITLIKNSVEPADEFLRSHASAKKSPERVKSLIEGFETPYGVELLATIHWVITHEEAKTLKEVINKVHAWNERKHRLMNENHIKIAYERLLEQQQLHLKNATNSR